MSHSFDEIHVFESVAERTGNKLERAGVRGRNGVCRSVTDLAAKFRRLGDGYYYLATSAWPEGTETLNLVRTWETLR